MFNKIVFEMTATEFQNKYPNLVKNGKNILKPSCHTLEHQKKAKYLNYIKTTFIF